MQKNLFSIIVITFLLGEMAMAQTAAPSDPWAPVVAEQDECMKKCDAQIDPGISECELDNIGRHPEKYEGKGILEKSETCKLAFASKKVECKAVCSKDAAEKFGKVTESVIGPNPELKNCGDACEPEMRRDADAKCPQVEDPSQLRAYMECLQNVYSKSPCLEACNQKYSRAQKYVDWRKANGVPPPPAPAFGPNGLPQANPPPAPAPAPAPAPVPEPAPAPAPAPDSKAVEPDDADKDTAPNIDPNTDNGDDDSTNPDAGE